MRIGANMAVLINLLMLIITAVVDAWPHENRYESAGYFQSI